MIHRTFHLLVQSNLNQLVSSMEDPEKVMTQSVVDLQSDLVKIRQSYAEVMASQKKMEKQKVAADNLASDWLGRAQLALTQGKDDLAREALERKQTAQDQADTLGAQIETQGESLNALFTSMSQ
jgi:phage shock protein A